MPRLTSLPRHTKTQELEKSLLIEPALRLRCVLISAAAYKKGYAQAPQAVFSGQVSQTRKIDWQSPGRTRLMQRETLLQEM